MKKLIIPLLFFLVNILPAQNYQNICSPGITIYKDQNQYFKAFRQDSVRIIGGNDTIFYSYRTIRDSSSYFTCRDTTNGDALGRIILKKNNGWFYFFNMKNDTIKLNSQASLNEAWKYCLLPGNCYLQAMVTNVITDSILGMTDQVKVISFQAKDAANSNISSIFNQKQIKLSQHYGLTKIYDIYWTPFDTLNLVLIGKTVPLLGVQPFKWADIYNFEVGDEFHYYDHQTFNGSTTVYSKAINRILGKTVYGNSDSVYYQVEECKKTWYPHPPPNTVEVHDTVLQKYNFVQMSTDHAIGLLPNEFSGLTAVTRTYSEYNNRQVQILNYNGYGMGWNGSEYCYMNPFEVWGPIYYYVPGLGQTKWIYEYADLTVYGYYSDLVYYKKGSETWGTPVATDCFILLSTENEVIPQEPSLEVFPNPIESEARILLGSFNPNDNLQYTLYNSSGMKVGEGKISSDPLILHRDGRASGLHILNISDNSGTIIGRTKIIFK
jgi:hypothetical protein